MTNDALCQLGREPKLAAQPIVLERGSAGAWPIAAVLLAVDVLCALLAALAAVHLHILAGGVITPRTFDVLPLSVALLILCFYTAGLYPGIALNPVGELTRIVKSTTIAFLILVACAFFERDFLSYSRAAIIAAWALCIGFVVLGRSIARSKLSRYDWWGVRTIVVGTPEQTLRMASTLNSHREYGLRVVASIPPSDDIGIAAGSTESKGSIWDPITGPFRDSNSSLSSIRYAILHLEGMPADKIAATLDTYSRFFNRTLLVADLPCGSSFGAEVRDLGGTLGLELPHHLLSSGAQTIKRVCDILVSATLLVLLAPLVALIVTAIKLTSKGPVLYAQSRIGFNGKPLQILKFRTMVLDADAALSEYLRCHPGLRAEWIRDHKLRRDPRVTSIGRYLRKLSLDELPQLWNILKGDMSLVGPRPITSKEIHRYGPQFDLYLRVVPGLTGLWQVSGRNNTTYRERVSYDEFYVRNWSIWMDLHILCLTVKTVLTTDGAY